MAKGKFLETRNAPVIIKQLNVLLKPYNLRLEGQPTFARGKHGVWVTLEEGAEEYVHPKKIFKNDAPGG